MAKIFAIANQKGGVGKTTTTVNLSASLAKARKKILLIDLDPQGNATMGCGVEKNELKLSIYDLLTNKADFASIVERDSEAGFDILPANGDLTAAEVEMLGIDDKENLLKNALALVRVKYDYIFIDCPPSLNMLTVNALVAADAVIIPMQCEYYALEGLSALSDTINAIASSLNPKLKIEGILRTMYDPRNKLTMEVSEQLKSHFGELVYRTVIPRNVRLAEAPSYGLPIIQYDSTSRGTLAYLGLAGEILRKSGTK